jgi:hypothetical protein
MKKQKHQIILKTKNAKTNIFVDRTFGMISPWMTLVGGISSVMVVGVFPHHHHNEAFCVSPDMETCATSSHDGCEGRHHCTGDADKHACDISCVTHLSFSVPHHLPDFTPDYTFYTLIYLSSLCLEAPSVSFERGDMISYYVEKLHARHFSAVRNFRAPPFAVVA